LPKPHALAPKPPKHAPTVALRQSKNLQASIRLADLAKVRKIRKVPAKMLSGKFCCDRKNPQVLPQGSPKTSLSDDSFVSAQEGFYRCPASKSTLPFGFF
jgi:hypothetical protein